MRITIIHGTNHKGSTYHIGRILAEKLASEDEIIEFFLPKDLNHFCTGCLSCIENESSCPFYSEKKIIEDAMENAELLVFTSPTYCMAPSASMKAFIDLFFQYWIPHRPRNSMFTKKAVILSTAAGAGMSKTTQPIKRTLKYWGVPNVYTYGRAIQATCWNGVSEKNKVKLNHDLEKLAQKIKRTSIKQPSPYIKIIFSFMSMYRKKEDYFASESLHWKEQGWLDSKKPWK